MTFPAADVDSVLDQAVEEGRVPLVAAMVADRTGVVYEGASGTVDTENGPAPVTVDTGFQIKSMTKMVTCLAAWQLVERGELDLDAPVEEFLPGFSALRVLDGFDGPDGDVPRLRAPASRGTVRQLMTSTVGLGYWVWNRDLVRYERITGLPNLGASREQLDAAGDDLAAFSAPLLADPGTRWEYGIGFDWLGRVLEVVAGAPLGDVVRDGITGPLGMTSTAFDLVPSALAAECPVYARIDDGWTSIGHGLPERAWQSGGDGLHSTPADYLRLQRVLLGRGELDGVRLLRPDSVEAMLSPQIGDLTLPEELPAAVPEITDRMPLGAGWSWGHGMLIATADRPGGRRAGSGGWTGLFNTHFWVDPATGVCATIFTSSLPFMGADAAAPLFTAFEQAVYAAL